jgi:hypothetical protein
MRLPERLARTSLILILLFAGGCTTSVEPVQPLVGKRKVEAGVIDATGRRRVVSSDSGGGIDSETGLPEITPAGQTYVSRIRTEVQPRGTIPYDNETLPLVSPDGRHIATQAGFAPDVDTLLARPGAAPPFLTRIEVYVLPDSGDKRPRFVTSVAESVLLGRACDDAGFLIEAPREDGSRWIGKASWSSGEITWLVSDNTAVSAFATLGPSGRLAWSTRPVGSGDEQFDLVVRHGERQWILPGRGDSWVMPTFSGEGDGLFALLLRADQLDLVHFNADSLDSMHDTLRRIPLATDGASLYVAYMTVSAHTTFAEGLGPGTGALIYFHPAQLRVAVWKPPDPPVLLDQRSIAAAIHRKNPMYVLVATTKGVLIRAIDDQHNRIDLFPGMLVPRATRAEDRPYILIQSKLDNELGIFVMQLLSPDEGVWVP